MSSGWRGLARYTGLAGRRGVDADIRQNVYIAIMGTIKVFGNKKHVAATHVRAITDRNEVFNHFLRAVYVTLSLRNPGGVSGFSRSDLFKRHCIFCSSHRQARATTDNRVEEAAQQRRARNMEIIPQAQRPLVPILLLTPICRLSSVRSWRLCRRIRVMMGCTSRRSRAQRAVMPASCESHST